MKFVYIIFLLYWVTNISAQELSVDDYLDLSIEELMKIKVVTASKQEKQISDVPASVIIITKPDIEAYGYQSLKEILSNVLGMYKIDDYRNVSFGVRGFFTNVYSRNIIFMINGVVQKQPMQNWNDLNLMNLQVESIQRIEVVRGPAAIIYGNDAFFGAINIITHIDDETDSKSSGIISYGSSNSFRSNFQVTSNTNNSNFNLSAGYYRTDGRDIPFNKIIDSVQKMDKNWIKDGSTNGYFIQDSKYINLSIKHKGFYANLSFDETDRNLIQLLKIVYDTTKLKRNDNIIRSNIGYKYEINPNFIFDIRSTYEKYNLLSHYNDGYITPEVNYGLGRIEISRFNYELLVFLKPLDYLNITFGANHSIVPNGANNQTDIPATGRNRFSENLLTNEATYSLFSQIDFEITKSLRFVTGFRADKQNPYKMKNIKFDSNNYIDSVYSYNYDDIEIIPLASLIYNLDERNIFKFIYSEAIGRPGIYENFYILWVNHPELVPQSISTTEFNLSSIILKNFSVDLSIFYNNLKNLLVRRSTFISEVSQTINTTDNSGNMETVGGEIQIKYEPINNLFLDFSLSYQNTKNNTFDIEAAYSPNILAYFKVKYSFTKDIIFSLSTYYVGSMEADWNETPIDPQNGNFNPIGRINETTPSYLNLSANIRFNDILKEKVFFNIHFDNILNSDFHYPPTYANWTILPNGTYDSGFQIYATLGIKF